MLLTELYTAGKGVWGRLTCAFLSYIATLWHVLLANSFIAYKLQHVFTNHLGVLSCKLSVQLHNNCTTGYAKELFCRQFNCSSSIQVAGVVGRAEPLSSLFFILTFLCYRKAALSDNLRQKGEYSITNKAVYVGSQLKPIH